MGKRENKFPLMAVGQGRLASVPTVECMQHKNSAASFSSGCTILARLGYNVLAHQAFEA
jgi:hypothetical protein